MKKYKNKLIYILLFFIGILLIFNIESQAANLSVSASKYTVSPGETFSVTVTVSGGAGYANISASNGTLSSSSTGFLDNTSATVNCTAGSSGKISIYVSGTFADYTTELDESKNASTSVTISTPTPPPSSSNNGGSTNSNSNPGSSSSSNNKPSNNKPSTPATPKPEEKKSNDSKLKSLTIAEGTISPEFSSGVKEYTLSVPNEITAINVTAATSHSKATYSVEGGNELQVGDNAVKVIVKAEDGTTSTYTITVNRARAELALQTLTVSFTDENGVITELPLKPLFSFDVYEYTMEKLSHTIKNLNIEALANLEGATVKIEGNEELKEGENKIIITITMPAETSPETGEIIKEEEIKTYTIIVEKETAPVVVPPTFWEKVQNWFAGIGGWISNNAGNIQKGSLMFCSVAMFALSIYLVIDYKKYKTLVAKLKQLTEFNSTNEAISESVITEENSNIVDENEIIQEENIETNEQKKKTGRHF